MSITGYETLPLVSAHVTALKQERARAKNEWHAAFVDGQLEIFLPELERMRAEAKKRAKTAAETLEASW